jgi:purine-binding chemotaxis protein CheW
MIPAERGYLLFALQGRRFAIDLSQVAEVSEPPDTGPIPGTPSCYTGAMNFHGTIVAIMDLAAFLGLPSCHELEKLIVLDTRTASLAFLVERVIRIAPQEQAKLDAAPDDRFASALIRLPDGEATLLDVAAIAQRAAETINSQSI